MSDSYIKCQKMDDEGISRRIAALDKERAELVMQLNHDSDEGPRVMSREDWLEARIALLEDEKALSKQTAYVASKRRSLGLHEVPDYQVQTKDGEVPLSHLFGPMDTLIMYHLMMAPGASACSICSFFVDHFQGGLDHTQQRVALVIGAKAPHAEMADKLSKKGWTMPFVSYGTSTLGEDVQVCWGEDQPHVYNFNREWKWGGQAPGLTVFHKRDGKLYRAYSTFAAGLGDLVAGLKLLDLIPEGRNEKAKGNFFWVKNKEEY